MNVEQLHEKCVSFAKKLSELKAYNEHECAELDCKAFELLGYCIEYMNNNPHELTMNRKLSLIRAIYALNSLKNPMLYLFIRELSYFFDDDRDMQDIKHDLERITLSEISNFFSDSYSNWQNRNRER